MIVHATQDPRFIEQVMEILHIMQKEQPDKFSGIRFKIEPRVEREKSKMQHFGSYEGPDNLTYQLLNNNLHTWNANPHAFWDNPTNPFWGISPTGELVAFYLNAKSGDC